MNRQQFQRIVDLLQSDSEEDFELGKRLIMDKNIKMRYNKVCKIRDYGYYTFLNTYYVKERIEFSHDDPHPMVLPIHWRAVGRAYKGYKVDKHGKITIDQNFYRKRYRYGQDYYPIRNRIHLVVNPLPEWTEK